MKSYPGYPYFVSHTHLLQLNAHENRDFTVDHHVLNWLIVTNGMWGMRPEPFVAPTYKFSTVQNNCHGSVKSFLQAYQAVRAVGATVTVASDFNGFATNSAPRFGLPTETCRALSNRICGLNETSTECGLAKEESARHATEQGTAEVDGTGTLYDLKGYASIDLVGPLYRDMENVGADVSHLHKSAAMFVSMWERADAAAARAKVSSDSESVANVQSGVYPSEEMIRSFLMGSIWQTQDSQ